MRPLGIRRIIATLVVWSAMVLLLPVFSAYAGRSPFVNARRDVGTTQGAAGISDASLEEIIGRLIKAALSLTGVIFFGFIVWAGFLWMTAHGETDKIDKAKKMISGAIIGLALTLAAYAITVFVVERLTAPASDGGVGVFVE